MQKDERFSRTHVAVLNVFVDYIREQLGNNGGSKAPRRESEALAVLVNHVTFRLDFLSQTSNDLVPSQLVRRLILDRKRRDVSAVGSPVYAGLLLDGMGDGVYRVTEVRVALERDRSQDAEAGTELLIVVCLVHQLLDGILNRVALEISKAYLASDRTD